MERRDAGLVIPKEVIVHRIGFANPRFRRVYSFRSLSSSSSSLCARAESPPSLNKGVDGTGRPAKLLDNNDGSHEAQQEEEEEDRVSCGCNGCHG